MSGIEIVARNPGLVLLWSFGLFMLMHVHQYLGGVLAAWRSGQTLDAIMSGTYQDHRTVLLRGLAAIGMGIPLAWVAAAFLWGRPIAWMGLSFRVELLLGGLALGLVLPVIVALVLRRLGLATMGRAYPGDRWREKGLMLLGIACTALFTGVGEEIVFRAMAAREVALIWGWPLAVLVAGAFFGVVHLVSRLKSLTVKSSLWIMVSSIAVSFMFVAMYARTGSIWLPIGVHSAWNFALVGVLGLPMDNQQTKDTDVAVFWTRLKRNSWLTGGSTGMEMSPVALAAYALVGLLFVVL